LSDEIKNNEMGEACGTFGRDVHTGFWWGDLREGCQWEYNIKMDLKEIGCGAQTGLFRLGIRASGRLSWMW
jgi:hypothetical protein